MKQTENFASLYLYLVTCVRLIVSESQHAKLRFVYRQDRVPCCLSVLCGQAGLGRGGAQVPPGAPNEPRWNDGAAAGADPPAAPGLPSSLGRGGSARSPGATRRSPARDTLRPPPRWIPPCLALFGHFKHGVNLHSGPKKFVAFPVKICCNFCAIRNKMCCGSHTKIHTKPCSHEISLVVRTFTCVCVTKTSGWRGGHLRRAQPRSSQDWMNL